jgi:polyisoprenyl-phosphate glycosyltransferase
MLDVVSGLHEATLGARPALFVSIVVPVFNEADALPEFHARLSAVIRQLGHKHEILFVNDGSRDDTGAVINELAAADPSVAVLNLSRNFGKEIALTAGLDHARGDAVVVIDADLQDPPELIPDLVAAWRAGADIAYGQRRIRVSDSWAKRVTAGMFYRTMQRLGHVRLPPEAGDFRLMSRRAVDAVVQLREHHRFMKGLFAWIGFSAVAVPYDRAPRTAGRTSWNYWKLWNFALEGITSFTLLPLKLATYVGLLVAICAVLYAGVIVVKTLLLGNPVAGYPSLMTAVLFLGGVQLLALGVIGEYLGRVFNETKRRPLYLVECYTPCKR